MSVYTSLSLSQLKHLLGQYELGEIIHYDGISDGIENTNYHVETSKGHYILTIFEHYKHQELPYYLQLMAFFRSHHLLVPEAIADISQSFFTDWQSKPAALFNKLSGQSILQPNINHCQQIGTALGHLHTIGQQFPLHKKNEWDHHWAQQTGAKLLADSAMAGLSSDDTRLLTDELSFQHDCQQKFHSKHSTLSLPQGVIHGDLFCDNALFANHQLSGIVDFYTACNDTLILDVAITANAWCLDTENALAHSKVEKMLAAYEKIRPLTSNEQQLWPIMLRAAGLRFWLSRLLYKQSNKETELSPDKDPDVLKYLLLRHRENSPLYNAYLNDAPEYKPKQYQP